MGNISRPDISIEISEGLKNFYSVIKNSDAYLIFAFITSVTKFSKATLFSGLNNLSDIILVRTYSAVCGYTREDLETVFADLMDGVDLNEIRKWYNGYSWLGEDVYNPFDFYKMGVVYNSINTEHCE